MSINSKSFGNAAQISGDWSPGVLLTRSIRMLNNTPEPLNGVMPSLEKPETRKVRNDPGPGNVLAETVQPLPVSPAAAAGGAEKLTTVGL